MPTAMGKSKLGPSFFDLDGSEVDGVRPEVRAEPELIKAVMTRSRDSFTAASGRPTITILSCILCTPKSPDYWPFLGRYSFLAAPGG